MAPTSPGDADTSFGQNLRAIRSGIDSACRRKGRHPEDVRIIAVAKTYSSKHVRAAVAAGVRDIGENDVRELRAKHRDVGGVATWHFVGILQTHTAHRVADLADVVHSAVPGRAAERLSSRAEAAGRRVAALLQVDLAGRRSGVPEESALAAFRELAVLPGIELAGLMTLPPEPVTAEDSRPYFRRLSEIRDALRPDRDRPLELSMGMSGDYEVAVEEGATMVRIGTALFGARPVQGKT